jgi:hypothetical protein
MYDLSRFSLSDMTRCGVELRKTAGASSMEEVAQRIGRALYDRLGAADGENRACALVRSVLGFGGLLPPGEPFATIIFSRTPIPREVADRFKPLALNVKVALLAFAGTQVLA